MTAFAMIFSRNSGDNPRLREMLAIVHFAVFLHNTEELCKFI